MVWFGLVMVNPNPSAFALVENTNNATPKRRPRRDLDILFFSFTNRVIALKLFPSDIEGTVGTILTGFR